MYKGKNVNTCPNETFDTQGGGGGGNGSKVVTNTMLYVLADVHIVLYVVF